MEGLREIFEHRCQLVTDAQSCLQVAIANVHDINNKCANSDGFQCSADCQSALESAASTAAANCATQAEDIFRQYSAACTGDCGTDLNADWNAITESCTSLSSLTSTPEQCTACIEAIDRTISRSSCLGSGNAAVAALNLLQAVAEQACGVDPAAKDLAGDDDVFASASLEVATQCRATGLCSNECQDAIDDLVGEVEDSYKNMLLPVPDSIENAVDAINELCATPFPGFSYRIRAVLNGVQCDDIQAASFDYIFRLAQVLGLSPSNLLITDCADLVTRETSASLTLGSNAQPDNAKSSDCADVSLSCSELSSENGNSAAAGLFVSVLLALFGVAVFFS